jgi:hypothetical protein
MIRQALLVAIGAASLALPAAASAQAYWAPNYAGRYYAQPGYGGGYYQPRGDHYGSYRRPPGYPEFGGIEEHIRREIREGLREDLIEPEDARDLFGQLRDIQLQEAREFRVHGWRLPDDDRYQLRARLNELDRLVDQVRAEPEG